MKLLLALLCLTLPTSFAQAQQTPDIFTEPPREAFGLGLVMDYEGNLVTTIQSETAIREACGDAFGCISWLADGETCQVRIWTGLPDDLERLAIKNLIARCSGWKPPGE